MRTWCFRRGGNLVTRQGHYLIFGRSGIVKVHLSSEMTGVHACVDGVILPRVLSHFIVLFNGIKSPVQYFIFKCTIFINGPVTYLIRWTRYLISVGCLRPNPIPIQTSPVQDTVPDLKIFSLVHSMAKSVRPLHRWPEPMIPRGSNVRPLHTRSSRTPMISYYRRAPLNHLVLAPLDIRIDEPPFGVTSIAHSRSLCRVLLYKYIFDTPSAVGSIRWNPRGWWSLL